MVWRELVISSILTFLLIALKSPKKTYNGAYNKLLSVFYNRLKDFYYIPEDRKSAVQYRPALDGGLGVICNS